MISAVKVLLWLFSTGTAFAGAWFLKFTRDDPNNPDRHILTRAGKITLPLATTALLVACALQIIDARQEAAKAAAVERDRQETRADLAEVRAGVGKLTAKFIETVEASIASTPAGDAEARSSTEEFLALAETLNPTLKDDINRTRRLMAGRLLKSPTEAAADAGDVAQLERVLASGVPVDSRGDLGQTALHVAALKGDVRATKVLIANGADVNARSEFGEVTPIFPAIGANSSEVVRLLLNSKADVNAQNGLGHTPVREAAALNRTQMVKMLIDAGANLNIADRNGQTPLAAAVNLRSMEAARTLIAAGADPNVAAPPRHQTAVHALFLGGGCYDDPKTRELISLLADHHADFNAVDVYGATPMAYLVQANCASLIPSLVAVGGSANGSFADGKSFTQKARELRFPAVLAALYRGGAR